MSNTTLENLKVAIVGAGSIGNHLAFSARRGYANVTVFDNSEASLQRFEQEIFPGRYGNFDKKIKLKNISKLDSEIYDVIFIGTPPDTHLELLMQVMKYATRLVIVEKPLTTPNIAEIQKMGCLIQKSNIPILVGYNHRVGRNTAIATDFLRHEYIGTPTMIESFVLESWKGILDAHPWLTSPTDSYLGFSDRGGGACFEHSHGLDLWRYYANLLNVGEITQVDARARYSDIDKSCDLSIEMKVKTEKGFEGLISQSVENINPRKEVIVHGTQGIITSKVGGGNASDSVDWKSKNDDKLSITCKIDKTRYDDFDREMLYISRVLQKGKRNHEDMILSGMSGLKTCLIASAALYSAERESPISINLDSLAYEAI